MNTKRHATRIPTPSQTRKIAIYTMLEWAVGYSLIFVMGGALGIVLAVGLTGGF